jgi:hypothetical protein
MKLYPNSLSIVVAVTASLLILFGCWTLLTSSIAFDRLNRIEKRLSDLDSKSPYADASAEKLRSLLDSLHDVSERTQKVYSSSLSLAILGLRVSGTLQLLAALCLLVVFVLARTKKSDVLVDKHESSHPDLESK